MTYDPTFPMMIFNSILWLFTYIIIPVVLVLIWLGLIGYWKDDWYKFRTRDKAWIWVGNIVALVLVVALTGFFIKI